MTKVLRNVIAIAILTINRKGSLVDFIASFFISVSFRLSSYATDLRLFEAFSLFRQRIFDHQGVDQLKHR